MYKHHAELKFSGPLMGSPTCSTTDVLLSWACLAEQQVCVEELTLGSIIPRGELFPVAEGVPRTTKNQTSNISASERAC